QATHPLVLSRRRCAGRVVAPPQSRPHGGGIVDRFLSRVWTALRYWREPRRSPGTPRARLVVEALESRNLPTTFAPGYPGQPAGRAVPHSTPGPTGYTPAQVRHAYGFDPISFGGVAGDGSGQTIAIVDAYDDPTIAGDLVQFDRAFGLPDPVFRKVNQS